MSTKNQFDFKSKNYHMEIKDVNATFLSSRYSLTSIDSL